MVKKTYFARETPHDPSSKLVEISASEWHEIVEANKKLPRRERRFFIESLIEDGKIIDQMYIEAGYEEYRKWNIEKVISDRDKRLGVDPTFYSLDEDPDPSNFIFQTEALTDTDSFEQRVERELSIKALKDAVREWEPWAYDLLLCYEAGEKRSCTQKLAKKYGITERAMRKRKKVFEEFCKNFLGS